MVIGCFLLLSELTIHGNVRDYWIDRGSAASLTTPLRTAPVGRVAYRDRMSAGRILVSSESDYESAVGYSRALRVGPHVAVSGTTGAGADVVTQTQDALRRIQSALAACGATLHDVVRTRIYLTDITHWREVGAVHSDVFGSVRPAATMVEVRALIAPELLVEIEVDAYLCDGVGGSGSAGNEPSGSGR